MTADRCTLYNLDLLFSGVLVGFGPDCRTAFEWWTWQKLGGHRLHRPLNLVRLAIAANGHARELSGEEEAAAIKLYCDVLDEFLGHVENDSTFLERAIDAAASSTEAEFRMGRGS